MKTMKTTRVVGYKDIRIETVDIPVPKDGEVLIKVNSCGVCGSDISAFYGKHTYIGFPIVLGHEFSGDIVAVGDNVNNVSTGDKVTILPHIACNKCEACKEEKYNLCNDLVVIGCQTTGAYAEYVIAPAKVAFKLPKEMTYTQGAFVEPSAVGYHGATRGVKSSDVVLIMGAGTIGNFAMQSANNLGASKTIICDYDEERLNLAKKCGATATINLSKTTLKDGIIEFLGDLNCVDTFIECVGSDGSALSDIIKVARRGATVVSVGIIMPEYKIPNLPDITEHELNYLGSSMFCPTDFDAVIELISTNKIKVDALVSHEYKMADIHAMYDMVDKKEESFMKIILRAEF